jgi:two-component system OmpR family sensor kinase
LRTPLTSIRGYAELYRQGARSPEEVDRAMARIEHEAVRMGQLVDDLLLLARLDQGRPLERRTVDLTELVVDAVAAARAIAPDRDVSLEVGTDPVVVTGDPDRLRQVVDNLLANVRDHTPPPARASVQVSTTAEAARVVVADDGPGMTSEAAARAFDRFWQAGGDAAGAHPVDGHRGTGLGLAIVEEIVVAHAGHVRLDTAPGRGATFTVTLPRATTPPFWTRRRVEIGALPRPEPGELDAGGHDDGHEDDHD